MAAAQTASVLGAIVEQTSAPIATTSSTPEPTFTTTSSQATHATTSSDQSTGLKIVRTTKVPAPSNAPVFKVRLSPIQPEKGKEPEGKEPKGKEPENGDKAPQPTSKAKEVTDEDDLVAPLKGDVADEEIAEAMNSDYDSVVFERVRLEYKGDHRIVSNRNVKITPAHLELRRIIFQSSGYDTAMFVKTLFMAMGLVAVSWLVTLLTVCQSGLLYSTIFHVLCLLTNMRRLMADRALFLNAAVFIPMTLLRYTPYWFQSLLFSIAAVYRVWEAHKEAYLPEDERSCVYCPHWVTCLVAESAAQHVDSGLEALLYQRARRYATLPIPDKIHTDLLYGSVKVALAIIITRAKNEGFSTAAACSKLAWQAGDAAQRPSDSL